MGGSPRSSALLLGVASGGTNGAASEASRPSAFQQLDVWLRSGDDGVRVVFASGDAARLIASHTLRRLREFGPVLALRGNDDAWVAEVGERATARDIAKALMSSTGGAVVWVEAFTEFGQTIVRAAEQQAGRLVVVAGAGGEGFPEALVLSGAPAADDVAVMWQVLSSQLAGRAWSTWGSAETITLVDVTAFRDAPSGPVAQVARASALLAERQLERAHGALIEAFRIAGEPALRRACWAHLRSASPRDAGVLAAWAFQAGDIREAIELGRLALEQGMCTADVLLTLAEAHIVSGDFASAAIEVEQAAALGAAPALVQVISGELALARSEFDAAMRLGAVAAGPQCVHYHRGRALQGKVLLSQGLHAQAEAQFAEDAVMALAAGHVEPALRARINRGVALIQRGDFPQALELLERASSEARSRGLLRWAAIADLNVGVLATRQRRYSSAIHWLKQAFELAVQGGDRAMAGWALLALAEIRLQSGAIDDAEQTLRFGARWITGNLAEPYTSKLAVLRAEVALCSGDADGARSLAHKALASPRVRDKLRADLWAAIAKSCLLDGDVAGAIAILPKLEHLPAADRFLLLARTAQAEGRVGTAREHALASLGASEDNIFGAIGAASLLMALGSEDSAPQIKRVVRRLREWLAGESAELRAHVEGLAQVESLLRWEAAEPVADESIRPVSVRPAGLERVARAMVGEHPLMRALYKGIERCAQTDVTVLVLGESGTGKELVADGIHAGSSRAVGPLVKVNCGALPESLLLSELFGHEKGAFTGASARRKGRFEMAEGGTLFLDEIGDISPGAQLALLRVLQERTFERVGGGETLHANVRVVCATHRDLRARVEQGLFREDLYYRLSALVLKVPALRERASDIPLIARALLERLARERGEAPRVLSPQAEHMLRRGAFMGNVRELENVLQVVSLFADGPTISETDLREHGGFQEGEPRSVRPPTQPTGALPDVEDVAFESVRAGASLGDIKHRIERECIVRALSECDGNITKAAALLGMKRPRLSQLVKQYGLGVTSEEVE